jgi:hypothetical protein
MGFKSAKPWKTILDHANPMKNITKQTLPNHGFKVCRAVQTILDQAKPNEKHTKANLVSPWV